MCISAVLLAWLLGACEYFRPLRLFRPRVPNGHATVTPFRQIACTQGARGGTCMSVLGTAPPTNACLRGAHASRRTQ